MIDNCQGIAHVGFFVSDIEKSKKFYEEVLGFETFFERSEKTPDGDTVRIAFLRLGDLVFEMICIPKVTFPADGCFQHLAIKVTDIEDAARKLDEMGIAHEELVYSPETLENGSKWVNFLGPDGEHLEFNEVL